MRIKETFLLPGVGVAIVAALVVVGIVAASGGGSDTTGGRETVGDGTDDRVADPGPGSAMCAEDVPDCDDMIVDENGDAGESPDDAVNSEPVTSIDDIDPDKCNMVHNIEVCRLGAMNASVDALAAELGVASEAIDLIEAELTAWPDGCLGVARPDTACIEMITPGFKVTLEHGGTRFEYHTNADGSQAIRAG